MMREGLISSSAIEEGAQLPNHGVDRSSSKPDGAATILTARLAQKGATTHVDLSASATIPEEKKFAHILGSGAVGR